ncbi:inorganic phosphate transporter [Paracoccus aminophilus]|uniref:Phosphate transporter n=1 Tax=Paracoccus aminophilus JCM 7686 TaxID=1367847 RepID=S5XK60_PARAH|nr:inorganic phosphate transporter [Paracoccus aminophilus]AGT07549.1 phosphate permease [Paracoccus aminophilus JCM 7686]
MTKEKREFRVLDKDLGRVTYAEHASLVSVRPVIRLGAAALFIAVAAVITFGVFGNHPSLGLIVAGVAVAAYLALSIGANDVANSLGPAVGAGAIGMTSGLLLVGLMQILGAVLAGAPVTDRLADGIILPALGPDGNASAHIMLAALLAAATWISLATWANAPVSTTHSIVGAIMGAGITVYGWQSVHWSGMAMIAAGWIISPVVSGVLAALLLALFRAVIYDRADRLEAARLWLPGILAVMGLLFGLMITLPLRLDLPIALTISGAIALVAAGYARHSVARQIALHTGSRVALKVILGLPLAAAALMMGFAHGSNDASNIVAPLTAILANAEGPGAQAASWTPLLAGLGIAAGAVLFGRRLVHMVGSSITRLNPNRALCVSVATAITVLGASLAGLPVSTTHVAIGGVFGVGFYREWRDRRLAKLRAPLPLEESRRRNLVRRSHMRTVFGAWLITVPAAAALAAALAWVIG